MSGLTPYLGMVFGVGCYFFGRFILCNPTKKKKRKKKRKDRPEVRPKRAMFPTPKPLVVALPVRFRSLYRRL